MCYQTYMLPSPCVTQPKNLIVEWLTGCYYVLSRLAHGDLNAVLCSGDQNIIHPCLVRTQHRLQPDMSSSIPTSAFVPHFYKTLITSQDLRHRVRFLFSRISLSDLIIIWPLRLHFPLYKWWIPDKTCWYSSQSNISAISFTFFMNAANKWLVWWW